MQRRSERGYRFRVHTNLRVGVDGNAIALGHDEAPNDATVPCFPTRDADIVRAGRALAPTPPWPDPTYPKTATGTVLVATECYAPTTAFGPDQVSGLPGPVALILNTRAEWTTP